MTVDRYGTLVVLFDCSEVTLIESRNDATLHIFCATFSQFISLHLRVSSLYDKRTAGSI